MKHYTFRAYCSSLHAGLNIRIYIYFFFDISYFLLLFRVDLVCFLYVSIHFLFLSFANSLRVLMVVGSEYKLLNTPTNTTATTTTTTGAWGSVVIKALRF